MIDLVGIRTKKDEKEKKEKDEKEKRDDKKVDAKKGDKSRRESGEDAKSRNASGGDGEKKVENDKQKEKDDKQKERDKFYEEAKRKLIAAREKKEKEEKEREEEKKREEKERRKQLELEKKQKEMKAKNELKNKLSSLSVSDIRAMLVDTLTEKEGMKKLSDHEKKKMLLSLNLAIETKKDEKKRNKNEKRKPKVAITEDSDESSDGGDKKKSHPVISDSDSSEDEDVARMKQKMRKRRSSELKSSSKSTDTSPKPLSPPLKSPRPTRSATKLFAEKESPKKGDCVVENEKIKDELKAENVEVKDEVKTENVESKEDVKMGNDEARGDGKPEHIETKGQETKVKKGDRSDDPAFTGFVTQDVDKIRHRQENLARLIADEEVVSDCEKVFQDWFIPPELLERSLEPAQVEMITEADFLANKPGVEQNEAEIVTRHIGEKIGSSPPAVDDKKGRKRSGGGQKWDYVLEWVPDKPVKKTKLQKELTIDMGQVDWAGSVEAGGKRTRRSNAKYGEEFSLTGTTDSEEDVAVAAAAASRVAPDSVGKSARKRRNSAKSKSSPKTESVSPRELASPEVSPGGKKRSSRDIIAAYMKSAGVERTEEEGKTSENKNVLVNRDENVIVGKDEVETIVEDESSREHIEVTVATDTPAVPSKDLKRLAVFDVEDKMSDNPVTVEDNPVKILEQVVDKRPNEAKEIREIDAEINETDNEISAILHKLSQKKNGKTLGDNSQLRGWSAQELTLPRTALNHQILLDNTLGLEEEGAMFSMEELEGVSLGLPALKCDGEENFSLLQLEVVFSPAMKKDIVRAEQMVESPARRGQNGKIVATGLGDYLYDDSDEKGSTSPGSFGSAKENLPNPAFEKRNSLPNKFGQKETSGKSVTGNFAKRKMSLQLHEAPILKKRKVS